MKKKLFIVSVLLNLFFIFLFGVFVYRKGGIGYLVFKIRKLVNPSEKRNLIYYKNKNSIYSILRVEKGSIVFLGDSIIERCPWNELFNNSNIINRGIGGDTSSGILRRIESICKIKPEKIFLMIGVNDVNCGLKVEIIANNINKVLESLKKTNAKIYVISVLPVNNSLYGYDINNEDIKKLNNLVDKICKDNSCIFIDLSVYFSDKNGNLRKELTTDGLHLNGNGYLILKKVLKPYVDN